MIHFIFYRISQLQETGVITSLNKKWAPETKECASRDLTSAISLRETRGAMYALAGGVGAAILILAVELLWSKPRNRVKEDE